MRFTRTDLAKRAIERQVFAPAFNSTTGADTAGEIITRTDLGE
jgi:hypothetical protein